MLCNIFCIPSCCLNSDCQVLSLPMPTSLWNIFLQVSSHLTLKIYRLCARSPAPLKSMELGHFTSSQDLDLKGRFSEGQPVLWDRDKDVFSVETTSILKWKGISCYKNYPTQEGANWSGILGQATHLGGPCWNLQDSRCKFSFHSKFLSQANQVGLGFSSVGINRVCNRQCDQN